VFGNLRVIMDLFYLFTPFRVFHWPVWEVYIHAWGARLSLGAWLSLNLLHKLPNFLILSHID